MLSACRSVLSEQLGCAQNDTLTPKVASFVYAGLSFVSFLICVPTFLLSTSQFFKKNFEVPELIFALVSLVMTLFSAVDSFQWIFAFSETYKGKIACKILGAFREYGVVMILVTAGCIGVHLSILRLQPKCLMVIEEQKNRRYKRLVKFYVIAIFLIPLLPMPFPFVYKQYGPSEFLCWISLNDGNCSQSYFQQGIIQQATLLYFWALVSAAVLALPLMIVTCTVCCQSSRQCTTNHCALLLMSTVWWFAVATLESLFVWNIMIGAATVPNAYIYTVVVCIPLFMILISSMLLVRMCYVQCIHRRYKGPPAPYVTRVKTNSSRYPNEAAPLLATATSTTVT